MGVVQQSLDGVSMDAVATAALKLQRRFIPEIEKRAGLFIKRGDITEIEAVFAVMATATGLVSAVLGIIVEDDVRAILAEQVCQTIKESAVSFPHTEGNA